MRARVKETGEIIEVQDCSADMYVEKFGELTGRLFHITELDFDNLESPDYWTRLEHQYAGMAMSAMLASPSLLEVVTETNTLTKKEYANKVACVAEIYAHALVEKYKKEERK